MENKIYCITPENLDDRDLLFNLIYPSKEFSYYISEDFSPEFYIKLAYAGFISVSNRIEQRDYLFPEIQFEYAVLHFKNLHISQKVKKLLSKPEAYIFKIDENFDLVLNKIIAAHKEPWLKGRYAQTLKQIYKDKNTKNFQLLSIELYDNETKELIAGEIGYKIGKTYTSLSGFTTRDKRYNNWGKLQLTLLAEYLQKSGFDFWNLGHPYMQYKLNLGAKVLSREEFLDIWFKSRD